MAKRYIRINWQNAPSVATPRNAENLNIMDKGIDDLDLYKVDIDAIVNNGVTTVAGTVLDGRMGKTLQDQITEQNNNLNALSGLNIVSNIAVDVSSVGDITAWYNGLTPGITMQYLSPSISISLFGSTTFLAIASFRSTQYGSILALSPNGLFYNRIDNGTWAGWKTTTLS